MPKFTGPCQKFYPRRLYRGLQSMWRACFTLRKFQTNARTKPLHSHRFLQGLIFYCPPSPLVRSNNTPLLIPMYCLLEGIITPRRQSIEGSIWINSFGTGMSKFSVSMTFDSTSGLYQTTSYSRTTNRVGLPIGSK